MDKNLVGKLTEKLKEALIEVKEIEKSVGIDLTDIESKKHAKERLENCLLPFKVLAAAWAGSVMLGPEALDDSAYLDLARVIAETGTLPESVHSDILLKAIAKGFGVEDNLNLSDIVSRVKEGKVIPALPYDLTFPEVFFELTEGGFNKKGFDVVLGNPPWERIELDEQDYYMQFNIEVSAIKEIRDRKKLLSELAQNEVLKLGWKAYVDRMDLDTRIYSALYRFQQANVDGKTTLGRPDAYRLFCERYIYMLKVYGFLGVVLPSSFYSNEGASGIRKLYLDNMQIMKCLSFENKRKLFDIDGRQKYACFVVYNNQKGTMKSFEAAFYLHDDNHLFSNYPKVRMMYSKEFIRAAGGSYLTFPELRSPLDYDILSHLFSNCKDTWGSFLNSLNIETAFGVELHRTPGLDIPLNKPSYSPELWEICAGEQWKRLPIAEGKTIYHFTDIFEAPITAAGPTSIAIRSRHWALSIPYYRFVFRKIASSTNERSFISAILPPGFLAEQSLSVETNPQNRPNASGLILVGLANSFCFDWLVRGKITTGLSNFLLSPIPIGNIRDINVFLSHCSLRLVSNYAAFITLWHEQLSDSWREPNKEPFTWPVLATDEERWKVRSAIGAVVADAYGLNREQYEHILKSFDRTSGPNPYTGICLAKFDELKQIGLEAFTKKYDPYWDIPLNEELPKPVIDLPIPQEAGEKDLLGSSVTKKRARRRK